VAAALIATAFLSSTMQTRIESTQDINKQSYLKALADYIVTNPGTPFSWGCVSAVPSDFGLAASPSIIPYEIDMDKISRLNTLNKYSLSYADIAKAAKLTNVALGIQVSQAMFINIKQLSNSTTGGETSFDFAILTSIYSKPVGASLHCYVLANNYLNEATNTTSIEGVGYITVQIPSTAINNAMLIVFARASFNDRITSYALYNFLYSAQQSAPSNDILALSPQNYVLSFTTNSSDLVVEKGYIFSYSYQQSLSSIQETQCPIPDLVDKSPFIVVVCGLNNAMYFQEWTAYPQIPLRAGSNFENSEQNIFSYLVTINDVLYRLDVSLGDVVS
jgi:hypothetical protein